MYELQYPAEQEAAPDRPLTRRALHRHHRESAASATTGVSASSAPSVSTPTSIDAHRPTTTPTPTLPPGARPAQVPLTRAQLRAQRMSDARTAASSLSAPSAASALSATGTAATAATAHSAPSVSSTHSSASAFTAGTAPSVSSALTGTFPMLFNIEEHGPLSPESGDITALDAVTPLKLRELDIHERMWLQEMRHHLRNPTDPQVDADTLSALYDKYCTAWHTHSRRNKWSHTYVTNALGVALGDLLITYGDDSAWMISEDSEVPTFAVRDNGRSATFFPIDAVTRRWLKGYLGWVPAFLENVSENFSGPQDQGAAQPQR